MLNPSGSLTSPEVAAFTPYPPDPSQNYATGGGFSNHFVYLLLQTILNHSTDHFQSSYLPERSRRALLLSDAAPLSFIQL